GVGGEVIKLVTFLGSSLPVTDVRLVPHLPIPALYFTRAISFRAMTRPLINQLRPGVIIFRRVGPASPQRADGEGVPIRLGMRGQCLRHETNLHQRLHAGLLISVKDPVKYAPVIDSTSGSILGISISRSPLQGGCAVARGKQIVSADVNRRMAGG